MILYGLAAFFRAAGVFENKEIARYWQLGFFQARLKMYILGDQFPENCIFKCFSTHMLLVSVRLKPLRNNHIWVSIGGTTMRSLVVYYSRTGNAKSVAEKVAWELKAETEELVDLKNRRGWLISRKRRQQIFPQTREGGNEKTLAMIRSLIPRRNIVEELGISKALENQADTESKISAWCNNLKSI